MSKTSDVAELAYRLWVDQGRPHGTAEANWYEAERQLARRGSHDSPGAGLLEPTAAESLPVSDHPATHDVDTPSSDTASKRQAAGTRDKGEVTLVRDGRQYGATYTVRHDMLELKTHTETRSIELSEHEPAELARRTLEEIVDAQHNGK